MANVQLENGQTCIATELLVALTRCTFTPLERKIIDIVILLTYTVHKTKVEINIYDLRLMLGMSNKNRTDRIKESLNNLIVQKVLFNQRMSNGRYLIGIQKDYEKWTVWNDKSDKVSPEKNTESDRVSLLLHKDIVLTSNSNTSSLGSDRVSHANYQILADYALRVFPSRLPAKVRGVELGVAKDLYSRALLKTHDPQLAYWIVKDYIDHMSQDKWVKSNVKLILTYGRRHYDRFLSAYPGKKPRSAKLEEETTGYRFKFDVVKERWVRTDEKLKN